MIHRGLLIALATLWLSATIGIAQYQRGPGGSGDQPKRSDYPIWEVDSEFTQDVFTFARIQYFEKYSVKQSYPLGINILVYAMTH